MLKHIDAIASGKVQVEMHPEEDEMPDDAIPATDMRAMGKNLEGIMKGDVSVDMSK